MLCVAMQWETYNSTLRSPNRRLNKLLYLLPIMTDCGGSSICETKRQVQAMQQVGHLRAQSPKSSCTRCGWSSICQRVNPTNLKSAAKQCGGSGIPMRRLNCQKPRPSLTLCLGIEYWKAPWLGTVIKRTNAWRSTVTSGAWPKYRYCTSIYNQIHSCRCILGYLVP